MNRRRHRTEDRAWEEYARAYLVEVLPRLAASGAFVATFSAGDDPERPNVRFLTSLGYAALRGLPILLVVETGAHVGPKLRALADEVIEGDVGTTAVKDALAAAVVRLRDRPS